MLPRRAVLAGAAAVAFRPALAAAAERSVASWSAYEARLQGRLADAGGGRFDHAGARDLAQLTNAARAAAGAPACAWDEAMAETARAHAADLAQRAYVEHLSPEGFDPSDRLGLLGRRMIGSTSENIAYHRGPGASDAKALMALWRGSPQHWMNLLRVKHTHAAFGLVRKADRIYAVGLYARPDGALSEPLPFRVRESAEMMRSVTGLSAEFTALWLDDHVRQGLALRFASGQEFGYTPPGVYRLRLDRRLGDRRSESLWGPIFLWEGPKPQSD
jgi:uncharacterized protein YkwD